MPPIVVPQIAPPTVPDPNIQEAGALDRITRSAATAVFGKTGGVLERARIKNRQLNLQDAVDLLKRSELLEADPLLGQPLSHTFKVEDEGVRVYMGVGDEGAVVSRVFDPDERSTRDIEKWLDPKASRLR